LRYIRSLSVTIGLEGGSNAEAATVAAVLASSVAMNRMELLRRLDVTITVDHRSTQALLDDITYGLLDIKRSESSKVLTLELISGLTQSALWSAPFTLTQVHALCRYVESRLLTVPAWCCGPCAVTLPDSF